MDKTEVRRMMREKRRAVSPEERLRRSGLIMRQLETLPEFAGAEVVLLYWSMADEVQTHALVEDWHRRKTVLLPCVQGDDLVLRRYTGPDCMVAGEQFGIGEPSGPEWTDLDAVQLVMVPGVAFDAQGNRMGRGRGFYDRLLKTMRRAVKVGVAYNFQMLSEVPVEPHDVRMDKIICD